MGDASIREVSPRLRPWLDNFNELMATLIAGGFKPTPTNAREGLANLTAGLVTDRPDIAWCQDDLVHGREYDVPVRIYHPEPSTALPVLVFFHGGGHMAGSVSVYDPIGRKLAIATRHVVVSVDYRLAPECPYPAGLNDAYAAAKGVFEVLERRGLCYSPELSIAGDSGGGALCASVAHLSQYDAGLEIHRQCLLYPSLDYTMGHGSIEQNARGYLLEASTIAWYFDHYFQHGENRKTVSPLYMDITGDLPETLLITAGFCPLRDEGLAYVERLRTADITVEHRHFDDMIHAYWNMEDLVSEECATTYRAFSEFLNRS